MILASMVLINTLVLNKQSVIEETMMDYRAKELALNIEMISDYQNPGYMRIDLPVNYIVSFEDAGPGKTNMTIEYQKTESEVMIHVDVEPQTIRTMDGTTDLCIREDLPEKNFFSFFSFFGSTTNGVNDPEDPDSDYEQGGTSAGEADEFVQVYNTTTYGGGGC